MMKKLVHIALLLAICLVAILLLHSIDLLAQTGGLSPVIDTTILTSGKLYAILGTTVFWRSLPSLPSWSILLNVPSLAIVAFLLVHAIYIWGVKKQLAPVPFAMVTWLYGLVPYGLGWWALHTQNADVAEARIWATVMLLGMFYCTGVSLFSVVLGLLKIDVFKALTQVPLPQVRFKTQPAAGS